MRSALRWLMSAAVLAMSGTAALPRPLDDVTASGTLRVIAYLNNKPFSFEAEDGLPHGIDVEVAQAIAQELGVKAEVVLRMQGEEADDDLRSNIWRGPLTGGGTGDLMMHVPVDREFAARNPEAVIGNAYFEQRIAVAIDPAVIAKIDTFDLFKSKPIAVQLGSVADYFLMTYDRGALIDNVNHYVKPPSGAKLFADKTVPALMGVRSHIEGTLHEAGIKPVIVEPPLSPAFKSKWIVGMAVDEKSRDLRDAIGRALSALRASGKLQQIFARHGVTYIAPETD